MAEIMGAFAHDLDNFVAYYEKLNWDTSFRGEAYPPRIVMEQSTPPRGGTARNAGHQIANGTLRQTYAHARHADTRTDR